MEPSPDGVLTQLRKGVVEFCVLACLRDGPAYGLELAERLGGNRVLMTSGGTLYPLLSRLREQGWVTTSLTPSPAGPPRRYYRLTPAGDAALEIFRSEWARFRADVDDIVEQR